MKKTRLALALIVTSLAATPALSASLTMLQFGSFETRDEAEKKLSDVSGKYKDVLGALPVTIREVKLPPDNLTVYRTQAGPVADRSTAQGICSKLAATGDECYIVQTAMVNGSAPALAATPTVPSTASVAADLSKAKADVMASTGAAPDLTKNLSTLKDDTVADVRDPLNREALGSVNTTMAENSVPDQSPEMKAALDKAVADQASVADDVATSSAAVAEETRGGFWSHLNPFSSSKPKAVAAPKATEIPAPAIEPVASAPLETPAVAAAPAVTSTPVIVANAGPSFNSTPVITQAPSMQLPPPPAPLKAQDRAALAAGKAPLASPEPVAAPIATAPTRVAPAPLVAGNGIVQVEEAKRVPVTSATMAPANTGAVPVVTSPFVQAPVSLRPSATEGMKTLWASIGPFQSNDEALSYWAAYRQNHPDFPVVRVRVTSSYQQLVHGVNNFSLRVGPIAQRGFVDSLCASLPQQQEGQQQIRCGVVSDLGASAPLAPTPGYLPASRYGSRH